MVNDKADEIIRFNPTVVIIHMGHNDLFKDTKKNPNPITNKEAMNQIWDFVLDLKTWTPNARIYFSSLFPRVPHKEITEDEVKSYNQKALRMGRYAEQKGMTVLFAKNLWKSITSAEGIGRYIRMSDGLHLRSSGEEMVAQLWIEAAHGRYVKPKPKSKGNHKKPSR